MIFLILLSVVPDIVTQASDLWQQLELDSELEPDFSAGKNQLALFV